MDLGPCHVREAMLACVRVCVCVLIAFNAVLIVHRREVDGLYVNFFSIHRVSGSLTVLERSLFRCVGVGTDQCGWVARGRRRVGNMISTVS
jgi:hypothetical protein